MNDNLRLKPGVGDLLAALLVIGLAVGLTVTLALRARGVEHTHAEIYQNGRLLMTVPLEQDREFPVEGDYRNTVTVLNGSIAITDSDCPGRDCVHSGAIRSPGRSLVCLPNALEIRVVSGQTDVDFVVG